MTPPPAHAAPRRRHLLVQATAAAMVLGVAAGLLLNAAHLPPAAKAGVVDGLQTVTAVFLRLIRMVITPLVLTTLTAGVARTRGAGAVGRTGLRTLLWFLAFAVVATGTGLLLVDLLGPGRGLHLVAPVGTGPAAPVSLDYRKTLEEIAPTSLMDAMAQNHVLQVVVFAVFAGVAMAALGERVRAVTELTEQVSAIMLKVTTYVMRAAPLAVFSALAATVGERGLGAVTMLGRFVSEFYLALGLIALWLTLAGFVVLGRRVFRLIALIREPLLVAFSTASSEAAYPLSLTAIQRFGVSPRVAGLVLPLGYAFNLDGTMVYSAFALVFVAQAYGIDLPLGEQVAIMGFLMLASKGAAGVPRGALIGFAIALETFHLPQAGVMMVLAVDAILDMGRTSVNVFGNAIATAAIARFEGELAAEAAA